MRRSWVPLLVLLAGFGTTVVATWFAANYFEEKTRVEFTDAVSEATEDVRARVDAYVALLRGCSGLFAVQRQVTSGEFRAFVARLRVSADYPGVQGIGYAARVRPGEEEGLIARMRAQGYSDFKLWPEGPREEYFPILFLEPNDRRNLAAIGYDMFSDPSRRAAMETARDSGTASASGRVTLVQEIEGPQQAGFVIYVPVYREGDVPTTIAERRSAILGFAYSPFRADDLFREMLSASPTVFSLRVLDSPGYGDSKLLHQQSGNEEGGRFESTRKINVAGRTWTLRFASQPAFEARAHGGRIPLLIFLSGILVTLLLFYFTNGEARARQTAEQTALRLKRSREALRESEERLRLVVDSARDYAILTLDPNGAVLSANSGAEQLYGYAPEELVGRNYATLFTLEERAAQVPEKQIAQCLETGRVEDDRWMVTKAGERRYVTGTARAIRDEFGHVHGLISVTRDITERRGAEETAQRASEQLSAHATHLEKLVTERTAHLEQSIASLEGVLYHVAHDLRAPLRAMHGFTSILSKEYGQHFDETGHEYARRISEAAARMDELITDLLEYGRLCHTAMPLGKVKVDEPVQRVLGALREEIREKNADVEVDASAAPVIGNAMALETIVSNLITNSLKFVVPGAAPKVRVCAEECDGVVRLSVKDNGIGIDPKYQDRVFRVFERLHGTDLYPGTGIGLAIVQKAAQRMHAEVGLKSTVGQGSTFWVELPKYSQEKQPASDGA